MKKNDCKGIILINLIITILVLLALVGLSVVILIQNNDQVNQISANKENAQMEINASYEVAKNELPLPIISYEPKDWTNGDVTVTITKPENAELATIQYRTSKNGKSGESANWTAYTETVTLTRNQTIYARLIDNLQTGNEAITVINNIDKLAPNAPSVSTSSSTNSITIVANSSDPSDSDYASSGISGYRFSRDDGNTWTDFQTSGTYTFENLDLAKTYNLKVQVKDNAGKTITVSKNFSTGVDPQISVKYNPSSWENETARITISKPSGYTLQYRTSKSGASGESSDWTTSTGTITLTRNQTIYARILDYNNILAEVSVNVEKIDKLKPVVESTQSFADRILINATDSSNEDNKSSGIVGYAVTTSNTVPSEFTQVSSRTSLTVTKTGLKPNTQYFVWVKDEAGNISSSKDVKTKQN